MQTILATHKGETKKFYEPELKTIKSTEKYFHFIYSPL